MRIEGTRNEIPNVKYNSYPTIVFFKGNNKMKYTTY